MNKFQKIISLIENKSNIISDEKIKELFIKNLKKVKEKTERLNSIENELNNIFMDIGEDKLNERLKNNIFFLCKNIVDYEEIMEDLSNLLISLNQILANS